MIQGQKALRHAERQHGYDKSGCKCNKAMYNQAFKKRHNSNHITAFIQAAKTE